ncbi:hypothetical protein QAD02_005314 [Eretmocerus hayati]|uniref:Uncharacterized protein n=1 Tax=Eretmocerus hayati TaxID=131215 RepID=A0ACC2NUZ9_9HYME|nr:hypothetical protein QAD02_005314 [Eretmocerus hayati]
MGHDNNTMPNPAADGSISFDLVAEAQAIKLETLPTASKIYPFMIKAFIKAFDMVDVSVFDYVKSFTQNHSKRHKLQKSLVFTAAKVHDFFGAPDSAFLLLKIPTSSTDVSNFPSGGRKRCSEYQLIPITPAPPQVQVYTLVTELDDPNVSNQDLSEFFQDDSHVEPVAYSPSTSSVAAPVVQSSNVYTPVSRRTTVPRIISNVVVSPAREDFSVAPVAYSTPSTSTAASVIETTIFKP